MTLSQQQVGYKMANPAPVASHSPVLQALIDWPVRLYETIGSL